LEPEPGKTKLLCPNFNGARNWPTTAFNPVSYILYVPLVETCADYSWTPRSPGQIAAGGDDIHADTRPRPDGDGKFGRIEAINLATGKVLWIHRQRAPLVSSLTSDCGRRGLRGSPGPLLQRLSRGDRQAPSADSAQCGSQFVSCDL
jgi:hypothetical protein